MSNPTYYAVDAITGEITERELTQEEIDALPTDSPSPSE